MSLLEATPVSFFLAVLAGMMLFMEWNMFPCESVEGKVVEEGRTGGWNMFLKIASLPELCTHAFPRLHHKSQRKKAILVKVPKVF